MIFKLTLVIYDVPLVKLPSYATEPYCTLLVIIVSTGSGNEWLGAVWQQDTTEDYVESDFEGILPKRALSAMRKHGG